MDQYWQNQSGSIGRPWPFSADATGGGNLCSFAWTCIQAKARHLLGQDKQPPGVWWPQLRPTGIVFLDRQQSNSLASVTSDPSIEPRQNRPPILIAFSPIQLGYNWPQCPLGDNTSAAFNGRQIRNLRLNVGG
ncbi:MAG: hypothetical protein WCJ35_24330 [Planctomycetota bacterium]